MKTYSIDYTKISEAENSLYSATRLMANDCYDAAQERIEEARKLLQEFLNQDNLVEDDDLADGLVRQSDAEAAIKEAVEEAEIAQKKAIDAMVQMCKDSNAAKTTISGKRPDGYIFETIIRKDGAVAFDEFTKDQVQEIENLHTKDLLSLRDPSQLIPSGRLYQEKLDIINVCRAKLEKGEYSDLEQFFGNKSNTQNEITEEEEDYQEQAKAVADWLNNNPNWNDSELCEVLSEHNMEAFSDGDIICRNEEYVVFRALKGYCFEERNLYCPYE